MTRSLIAAAALSAALFAVVIPSCSSETPTRCSSTCSGCCTASGACLPGTTNEACGSGGALCAACTEGACREAACAAFANDGGDDGGTADRDGGAAGPDAGVADAGEPDAGQPADAGYPTRPGIYATITATSMAGTWSFTNLAQCNPGGGGATYTLFAASADTSKSMDVQFEAAPRSGQTLVFGNRDIMTDIEIGSTDNGYYPLQGGSGSCTVDVDTGWPRVRARFHCEGLTGAASGTRFDIRDGFVVCP